MLKTITNKLAGRNRSLKESLSISELNNMLKDLEISNANMEYSSPHDSVIRKEVSLKKIVDFVNDKFFEHSLIPSIEKQLIGVKHEVYSGKFDEKHYFELTKNYVGGVIWKYRTYQKATIDFLVQK